MSSQESSSNTDSITPSKAWFLAIRPKTLPAAVAPVMVGSALAFYLGGFQLMPAFLCLIFALLMQIGSNFANDYYDYLKGVDTEERIGFKRAVASGWITPAAMKQGMVIVLACGMLFGLWLIYYGGVWLLAVGVLSIICAIGYTGGPFPMSYYGLGDVLVFIFFGLIATAFTAYVQLGHFPMEAFLLGAGVGLLSVNTLNVNNIRDVETDQRANKRTLPVRFGRKFAYGFYVANYCLALSVPIILYNKGYGWGPLLAWLTVPIGIYLIQSLIRCKKGKQYNSVFAATAQLMLGYSTLLSLGIVLS